MIQTIIYPTSFQDILSLLRALLQAPSVAETERALTQYTGYQHCILTPSGSDATAVILKVLCKGAKQRVSVSNYLCEYYVHMIKEQGHEIITENIDRTLNVPKYSKKSDIIIVSHLNGKQANIPTSQQTIIEDCAQYLSKNMNTKQSTASILSFGPGKPLYGVGGGAILCDDAELEKKIRKRLAKYQAHTENLLVSKVKLLINYLMNKRWIYSLFYSQLQERHRKERQKIKTHSYQKSKRMNVLMRHILLRNLKRHEEINQKRERNTRYYDTHLPTELKLLSKKTGSSLLRYPIKCKDKKNVQKELKQGGVGSSPLYPQTIDAFFKGENSSSDKIVEEILFIPNHPGLKNKDQDKIINILRNIGEHS